MALPLKRLLVMIAGVTVVLQLGTAAAEESGEQGAAEAQGDADFEDVFAGDFHEGTTENGTKVRPALPPLELDGSDEGEAGGEGEGAASAGGGETASAPAKTPPQQRSKAPEESKAGEGAAPTAPAGEGPTPVKGESGADVYELDEAEVVGRRRKTASAASFEIDIGELAIIPRKNVAEQLMMAPGVLTTNHGGEGHANEVYMRGFASSDGRDIEFTVDGVPLNEVSNPHGHGYADLLFIPPEFVQKVNITEGPFEPRQGDFAFAGSADYQLSVPDRGSYVRYGFGRFETHRVLATVAPEGMDDETFAGFEFYRSGGFGPNRAAQRASGIARYAMSHDEHNLRWRLTLFGYSARYDQAGVVRQDDFESGEMGFFDTYDSNQGGESHRFLLSLHTDIGERPTQFRQVSWFGYRTLRMRANFTGWLTDDPLEPEQRGDGTELRYEVLTVGSRGEYPFSTRFLGHDQSLSIGYALRYDNGESSQQRLRSLTGIPYSRVFSNEFSIFNLAGWLDINFQPLDWLVLRGGVRLDTFAFGVTDLNQPESDREGLRLTDQTAQAFGYAVNPRATLDFTIIDGLHFLLSYGQGTRSTEAAALSDNETAPFALAHQAEGGLSYQYGRRAPGRFSISAQGSYVYSFITKDLLFSETAGRNILVGSSSRHAALIGSRLTWSTWLDVLFNFGYTHAVLNDTGELLPYIPQFVVRLDAAVTGQLFEWEIGGVPVAGRVGLGFTYVPGRPLPLKQFGDPFYLINLGGELRLWYFSVGVEIRNLLNLQYRQSEFHYASNFESPTAVPSRVAMRHFAAGEPFFVMGTLTLHVEELFRR